MRDLLHGDPSGIADKGRVVHICRQGNGVVQMDASPVYNLHGLTPLDYPFGPAFYVEQDYFEGYLTVVRDFLRPDEDRSALQARL